MTIPLSNLVANNSIDLPLLRTSTTGRRPGTSHCFSDDDRRRYVRGLAQVVEPGGGLFLLCFSDEGPGTEGPRRVSRIEVNPEFTEVKFSEGGPKAWFAVVRRKG